MTAFHVSTIGADADTLLPFAGNSNVGADAAAGTMNVNGAENPDVLRGPVALTIQV